MPNQDDGPGNTSTAPMPRHISLLRGLVGAARRLQAESDVNSVLRAAAEAAMDLIGAHHAAAILAEEPGQPRLLHTVVSAGGRLPEWEPLGVAGPEFGLALEDLAGPIRLAAADLATDPTWSSLGGNAAGYPVPNGWLAAPLLSPDGRRMGLIEILGKVNGEFDEDDELALAQFSLLAAAALGHARDRQKLRDECGRKDEFLAMLAHELRNPLAAIGSAVGLARTTGAGEDLAWPLEVISRQTRHLTRLIDDLMDVSRIARGKIRLRREVMDVGPILESAAATAGPLIQERGHTLDLAIDRRGLWAKVDPTRLEQVVVNLLNNAAKYSEDGGRVRLEGRLEGGEVVVRVKDGGIGIPPEKLAEMFELFAQGDSTPGRSEGGLGIGLAVVKRLVELHGGSVAATSDGPGAGSEFTIRLPAVAAAPAPAPANGSVMGPRRARILLVDDDEDTVRMLERLLQLAGHEVVTALRGAEAIEVAKAVGPEFVLLDIGLPGMTGFEVASTLRRDGCCATAVFIAISGYGQEEDRRRSRAAGFHYHFTKPLDHDALLSFLSAGSDGLL